MADLGSDFDRSNGGLLPDMRLLESPADQGRAFMQSQAERLLTDRGALWYDLNYGTNIRNYIADDTDPAVAADAINKELLKDERCARCTTLITVSGNSWNITTSPVAVTGVTYDLTFVVSADKAALLTAGPR